MMFFFLSDLSDAHKKTSVTKHMGGFHVCAQLPLTGCSARWARRPAPALRLFLRRNLQPRRVVRAWRRAAEECGPGVGAGAPAEGARGGHRSPCLRAGCSLLQTPSAPR